MWLANRTEGKQILIKDTNVATERLQRPEPSPQHRSVTDQWWTTLRNAQRQALDNVSIQCVLPSSNRLCIDLLGLTCSLGTLRLTSTCAVVSIFKRAHLLKPAIRGHRPFFPPRLEKTVHICATQLDTMKAPIALSCLPVLLLVRHSYVHTLTKKSTCSCSLCVRQLFS